MNQPKERNLYLPSAHDFCHVKNVFEKAGYTDSGVLKALGINDFPSIRQTDLPHLLYLTSDKTPLTILIRLFLIEVPCEIKAFEYAVHPMNIETWIDAGLIYVQGDLVFAAIKLLPYKGLLLAFDRPQRLSTSLKHDYVMGIGTSTITLSNLILKRPVRQCLDLGTGCGTLALLAAHHSDHVIAVDRNPRAIQFAQFNAQLNGFSQITCIEGDMFEPVKDRTFDLIVTNPPFVISPETSYIYRDSGMEVDRITQKIVQESPQFLNEKGYCHILCNWAEYENQDWKERLRDWFKGTECDVWVMRSETRDTPAYASTWIKHTEKNDGEHFTQRFNRWMKYYEQHHIKAISAGFITMRKRSGSQNWLTCEDGPEKMLGQCGDYIEQGFRLRDFLEEVKDDAQLLNSRLLFAPHIHLERHATLSEKGWIDGLMLLKHTCGLAYTVSIDSFVAHMISACNGQNRLSDLLTTMASHIGIEQEKITSTFCQLVRSLIEKGFLLPAK